MKIYFIATIVFFTFLIAVNYSQNENKYDLHLTLLPQLNSETSGRLPASVTNSTKSTSGARLGIQSTIKFPPILSPDNPIKPRVSSAQAGDPSIINLFNPFNLNIVNQPSLPTALCNDGSRPAYYLKKGFGAGTNRWIIWTAGGGGCGSADPMNPLWCGQRKNTPLSSSNGLPGSLFDFTGILSKDAAYNEDFYSYNQVVVHYCSSDFWGGVGAQKVINQATGEKWWFSGRKIIEAVIVDLKARQNFNNATNIILTGSSAGGGGIMMNADEVKAMIPTADIVTNVDAANIIPYYRYVSSTVPEDQIEYIDDPASFKEAYSFLPMEGNRNCLRSLPACPVNARCIRNEHLCMLPGYAARFVRTPVFMSSDQLDNSILAMYSLNFCTERNAQGYSDWLNSYTAETIAAAKTVSGYFLPRTGEHGLTPTHHWSTPVVENGVNVRLKHVFGAWYFNRSTFPKRFIQSPQPGKLPHEESNSGLCPNL